MGLQVQTSGKMEAPKLKLLVCGNPGAGKTRMASTFPNPFYISAEGGLLSIRDRDVPYIEMRQRADLYAVKEVIEGGLAEKTIGRPVDTLVIDTIDEVQNILMRERLEDTKSENFGLQDWGWIADQMKSLIRGLRSLPVHVIFTCHLKETSDSDSGEVWFEPGMQGQTSKHIPAAVDLALVLTSKTKVVAVGGQKERVVTRMLQTYPDRHHRWIKDRSGKLPPNVEIDFENDFQRISDLIYGDLTLPDVGVADEPVSSPVSEAPSTTVATEEAPAAASEPEAAPAAEVESAPEVADGPPPGVDAETGEVIGEIPVPEPEPDTPAPRADSPLRGDDAEGKCEECEIVLPPNKVNLSKLKNGGRVLCSDHATR